MTGLAAAETALVSPTGIRRVLIRDLVMHCSIGVHAHEHESAQRVRVNLDIAVLEDDRPLKDDLRNVVCYDDIIVEVRRLVGAGHVRLLETLAERIAAACLTDPRVQSAIVQIEKLDVYTDVAAVGVAIERRRADAARS